MEGTGMASGLIFGLEKEDSERVIRYYERFHIEPARNIVVTSIKQPECPATLESLMIEMMKANEKNFLVVAHGSKTGTLLFIGLANRGNTAVGGVVRGTMISLSDLRVLGAAYNRMNITPKEKATPAECQALGLTEAEVRRLVEVIRIKSRHRTKLIEFRGCNLGNSLEMLLYLRLILSAEWIGAPNLFSQFGNLSIETGKKALATHENRHIGPFVTEHYLLKKNPREEFKLCTSKDGTQGHVVAKSMNTIKQWTRRYIGEGYSGGHKLPIHYFWNLKTKVNTSNPLADIDDDHDDIYLPLQREYARHIVYA